MCELGYLPTRSSKRASLLAMAGETSGAIPRRNVAKASPAKSLPVAGDKLKIAMGAGREVLKRQERQGSGKSLRRGGRE